MTGGGAFGGPPPPPPKASELEPPPQQENAGPLAAMQVNCGLRTCAEVAASSVSNHAAFDNSRTALPFTGRTQAKSLGDPAYVIWSHRTVCVGETANAIRCPVTTVLWDCICGEKHPPHARASRVGKRVSDAARATHDATI
jgi:hypothetical protein